MKEATGELSMTVITIIAIVAIAGIVTFLTPMVRNYINHSWENLESTKGYCLFNLILLMNWQVN